MNRRNAQIFFFLSLLIISIVISFFIVRPFISTLILAIVAAVVFYPIHKMFYKFFKAKWLAATLTILIFFSTILAPMSFFGVRVVEEAQTAYRYFTETIDGIVLISNVESFINKNIFERFLNIEQETEGSFFLDFNSYVQDVFNWLVRNFGAVASGLARVGINLMLFIFAMFFLLRDGEGIKKFIVGLSPLDDKYDEEIFKRLSKSINSVIRGSLMIAVIQGILAGVGFTLFGIPSPILWAGAVMVAALVPALGTAVVSIPAVAYLFIAGQTVPGIGLLIWSFVAVGLIDNILYPKLVSRDMQIHPFLILLFVIGGISFFGLSGFILGPITLSFLFALIHIYQFLTKQEHIKSSV